MNEWIDNAGIREHFLQYNLQGFFEVILTLLNLESISIIEGCGKIRVDEGFLKVLGKSERQVFWWVVNEDSKITRLIKNCVYHAQKFYNFEFN